MSPNRRALRQYGSKKRLTPAERLYQLQYRIQAKGEAQKRGDSCSKQVQPISVSTLKQRQTLAPLLAPRYRCSTSSNMANDSSDEMLLVTADPSEERYGNGVQWPTLPAPSPPIAQSKNIMDLKEAFLDNTVTNIEFAQATQIPNDQPPSHHPNTSHFLNLPQELRTKILQFVLLRQPDSITPNYSYCSVEVPEGLALEDNIDASLLQVNKQLHAEASQILYTENTFSFHSAEVALWFLNRIGPTNVLRLRSAAFILDTGEVNNPFGVPRERRWRNLFAWLKPRHQLHTFIASFRDWRMDSDLTGERDQVIGVLFSYRGLKHVSVKRSECISKVWAGRLERYMKMKDGERDWEMGEAVPGKRAVKPGLVFRQ